MKRRAFFGLLAGGAVAGPGMVNQAAASLADLSLAGAGTGSNLGGEAPMPTSRGRSDWNVTRLARLAARTAEQHEWHKQRTAVHSLDPDLASYRSFALHRKISLQRDRNYERELTGERSYLEAAIAGWFE